MPGFADQVGLERLGLILQFVGGFFLLEGIFSDQVVDGLTRAFKGVRGWIADHVVVLYYVALFLAIAAASYSHIQFSNEVGISWWKPSFDWWRYMLKNPGSYFRIAGIQLGIYFGVIAGVALLSWLIYAISSMLSRARRIKRTVLIAGILAIICGFIADYSATLMSS